MKETLMGILIAAAVVALLPFDALAVSGATVRSQIMPSDPNMPGYTIVKHFSFEWGRVSDGTTEIVAYATYEDAKKAVRSMAVSACDNGGVNQVLLTGNLFTTPERRNCAGSNCFLSPPTQLVTVRASPGAQGRTPNCYTKGLIR